MDILPSAKKSALEFGVLSDEPFYINTHLAHPYSTPPLHRLKQAPSLPPLIDLLRPGSQLVSCQCHPSDRQNQ